MITVQTSISKCDLLKSREEKIIGKIVFLPGTNEVILRLWMVIL